MKINRIKRIEIANAIWHNVRNRLINDINYSFNISILTPSSKLLGQKAYSIKSQIQTDIRHNVSHINLLNLNNI